MSLDDRTLTLTLDNGTEIRFRKYGGEILRGIRPGPWHSGWTRGRWADAFRRWRSGEHHRTAAHEHRGDLLFISNLMIDRDRAPFETGPWWMPLRDRLRHIKKFDRNSFMWPGRGPKAQHRR